MSRYLRLRAEQVRMTLWGGGWEGLLVGWRVAIAVSRSRISQSQRSASVRGSPRAILAMLVGVWYCVCLLVRFSMFAFMFYGVLGLIDRLG